MLMGAESKDPEDVSICHAASGNSLEEPRVVTVSWSAIAPIAIPRYASGFQKPTSETSDFFSPTHKEISISAADYYSAVPPANLSSSACCWQRWPTTLAPGHRRRRQNTSCPW